MLIDVRELVPTTKSLLVPHRTAANSLLDELVMTSGFWPAFSDFVKTDQRHYVYSTRIEAFEREVLVAILVCTTPVWAEFVPAANSARQVLGVSSGHTQCCTQ